MENKELSQRESLALINLMINKAKDSFHGTGMDSMMWGLVIAVCSLVRLAQVYYGFSLPFSIYWLTVVALFFQIGMRIRERKHQKAVNYDSAFITPTWTAFGICIGLLIMIINFVFAHYGPVAAEYKTLTGNDAPFRFSEFVMPLFLMLYGMPTFITGMGCKFKPMLIGGIICWVSCIIACFTNYKIDLLLTALSAIVAWFIPGLLMEKEYRRYKKEQATLHV
jgi:hypothetical protein